MELISLSNLVEEVASEFIMRDPRLKVSFEIEKNIIVQGDYNIMLTVLRNLVANAINCTMNIHNPTIVFGQIENEKIYFIMDNGNGFDLPPAHHVANIFDHPSLEGLASELTVVKRIFIKHGGKIWGVSKEGLGAVFYFLLN